MSRTKRITTIWTMLVLVVSFVSFSGWSHFIDTINTMDMGRVTQSNSKGSLKTAFPLPANLDAITNLFNLSQEGIDRLLNDGVLVLGNYEFEEMGIFYDDLAWNGIPLIVTTDAWLHLFHTVHDDILKQVELTHLFHLVESLVQELQAASIIDYEGMPPTLTNMTEAAFENVVFASVACRLLNDSWSVPSYANSSVQNYLDKIYAHSIVEIFPGEDYTQYKPRGHYAGDPVLEAYFRCMKWLGRGIFLLIEDPLSVYPALNARHIRQIVLFSEALRNSPAKDLWDLIYNVTGRFAGYADSVTPFQVQSAVDIVFGPGFSPSHLESHHGIIQLQQEFLKPEYPVPEILPVDTGIPGYWPKYAQLMGERWIPDSANYQETIFPKTNRLLPTALEAMYTMLGSERALELIMERPDSEPYLEEILQDLHNNVVENFTIEEWHSCIYMNWLNVLSTLIGPFNASYPAFMNTTAWLHEKLNTALGSYTQLRHDYILYAKGGSTATGSPSGYAIVEPIPEFYSQLHHLFSNLHTLLLVTGLNTTDVDKLLNYLLSELSLYPTISQKILNNETLSFSEEEAILEFGLGPGYYGNKEPMLVADIWTDYITKSVLEEGVGKFNPLLVIHQTPGNDPIVYVGLVFSYYEFIQPDFNRLTDQEWQVLLITNPPDRPEWTQSFLHYEYTEYLQTYERSLKWELYNTQNYLSSFGISYDERNTFYMAIFSLSRILSLNISDNQIHQLNSYRMKYLGFGNNSLFGAYQNAIYRFHPNGTLLHSWTIPNSTSMDYIWDLSVDSDTGKIYVTGDFEHSFYEFSSDGFLIQAWGEWGFDSGQFYHIVAIHAANDILSIIDENHGLLTVNLTTHEHIRNCSLPFPSDGVWDFFQDPEGNFFILDGWQNFIYKLSSTGEPLALVNEIETNTDTQLTSLALMNSTHFAVGLKQIDQVTGNQSLHISIYGFVNSRPARPVMTPLNESHSLTNISLTWTPSYDIDGEIILYQLEISEDPFFVFTNSTIITTQPEAFVTGLENDTSYYFRVFAQDNAGWNSTRSASVHTHIIILTHTPPTEPSNVLPYMYVLTFLAIVAIIPLCVGITYLIGRKYCLEPD